MEQLQAQAINALQIVAGGLLSLAGIYAMIYINKAKTVALAKVSQIKDEQARDQVKDIICKTDDLLETGIVAVENTLKPAIVQSIADGKVDKSELNSLATVVKEFTVKQLGDGGMKILNESLGDANSYLENRIEKILAELKSDEGTVVNKTVIPEATTSSTTTAEASITPDKPVE